ncbi:hypothetical protein AZE42_13349, partial [Rhizopogon vesiculosus]
MKQTFLQEEHIM